MQRRRTEKPAVIDHDRESVPRPEVLSREEIDAQARQTQPPRGRRSRFPQRLIPLLILAVIAVLIARQEIPAVDDWWEKTFAAGDWQIKQTCREAAVELSGNRVFTRVVKGGTVHQTEEGFYVDRLVLGEMGRDGVEQRVEYTCYLDASRRLVRLNRLDDAAPPEVP